MELKRFCLRCKSIRLFSTKKQMKEFSKQKSLKLLKMVTLHIFTYYTFFEAARLINELG